MLEIIENNAQTAKCAALPQIPPHRQQDISRSEWYDGREAELRVWNTSTRNSRDGFSSATPSELQAKSGIA